MSFQLEFARCAWRGAIAGVMAALLLMPALALSAGKDLAKSRKSTAADVKGSDHAARHKISPHEKAARERAQAANQEHRPNLRLSNRGVQKASNH